MLRRQPRFVVALALASLLASPLPSAGQSPVAAPAAEHDPATTLMGRMPTMWEAYRPWILGGASLLIFQTLLIAGLLAERRRRRDSQRQLAERLRLQALVASISSEFANLPGDRLEARIEESLTQVGSRLGLDSCAIFTLDPTDQVARVVSRWSRATVTGGDAGLTDAELIARTISEETGRAGCHAPAGSVVVSKSVPIER